MDAVEFLKERIRMCETLDADCDECPIYIKNGYNTDDCYTFMDGYPEKAVKIVEEWAKEHPRKTNKDKLVEVFGSEIKQFIKINANACILAFGCRGIGISCKDCQYRYFWNQEYKEPERSESE